MLKRTNKEFVKNAKKIHKGQYDYSETQYVYAKDKVTVICPKHGKWKTTYHSHVTKEHGCQKCSALKRAPSIAEIIGKFRSVHGLKYDYSESEWNNSLKSGWHSKVKIICKIHGSFLMAPAVHYYQKAGCQKCSHIEGSFKQSKPFERTIKDALKIHGNSYKYLRQFSVDRENSRGKRVYLELLCKKHPDSSFIQRRSHHLSGSGCPICKESHGERAVSKVLDRLGVNYTREKSFPDLRDKSPLFLDFWLHDLRIIIEYDGEQHYIEKNRGYYKNKLTSIQRRDSIKNRWAKDKGLPLLRIKWNEDPMKKIIELLKERKIL